MTSAAPAGSRMTAAGPAGSLMTVAAPACSLITAAAPAAAGSIMPPRRPALAHSCWRECNVKFLCFETRK
jgi:hypothetical protein